MSTIILVGFGWGLLFAVGFVSLGYPTFLSLLFGVLGGWAWSTIATYWTSEDTVDGLPSYLRDIAALRQELSNLGTGGRIDLNKVLRRRDAKGLRLVRQAILRKQLLRHRGRPVTLGDRLKKLRDRLMPPKKKKGEAGAKPNTSSNDPKNNPNYDEIIAKIEAEGAEIDAQLKQSKS